MTSCRAGAMNTSTRAPAVSHPSGTGGDVEAVDPERGAEIGANLGLLRLEPDAGGIGDPIDRVEEPDHARRIGETGRAYRLAQRDAGTGKRRLVPAEHGLGELDEQAAVRNACIALDSAGHGTEIVLSILGHAARTEQQGVAGRSIETLIERRYPRR